MSDPRGLCGATRVLASGGRVGPCVLPAHDGPVHQDAGGRRWAGDVGARPPGTDLRAKIAEALAPFCLVHTVQTEPCRTCAQRLDAVMAVVRPALDETADPRRSSP